MATRHRRPKLDFDAELSRGRGSYDKSVGQWWSGRAADRAHRRAYALLAEYLKRRLESRAPDAPLIVDYACGEGGFLTRLALAVPRARIVGLDGSERMLTLAAARLHRAGIACRRLPAGRAFRERNGGVRLVRCLLPNFSLPAHRADAAVFLFPNLTCADSERPRYERHGYRHPTDVRVARALSEFREMDPEEETGEVDPEELEDDLLVSKVIARNLRRLLKPGGVLLRSDYANAPREELSELTRWRTLFTEGALDVPVRGLRSRRDFRFQDSWYRRSSVILDVYHQTGDSDDREGGYFASLLRAV